MKVTTLFNPHNATPTPAIFAFYVVDNTIDNTALLDFKIKTQAKLLIALITNEQHINEIPFTDTCIYCKADEIETVISTFDTFFTGETLISIEPEEALVIFANQKNVHFISIKSQAHQKLEQVIQLATDHIPEVPLAKLCVLVQGENVGFDEFNQVSEAVANGINDKNLNIFYALDLENKDTNIALFAIQR